MALRNILNQSLHHGSRHFSSSTTSKSFAMAGLIPSLTATNPTTKRFTTVPYLKSLPLLSTPWLRLPIDARGTSFSIYDNFLNIVDKRLVKVGLGIDCNISCVGATRGSLAYLSESGSMFLSHPYICGGSQFYLYHDQWSNNTCDCSRSPSLHSSTRCCTQVGNNAITVLCEPRHNPDSRAPNCYQDCFVSWFRTSGLWDRCNHLFHKEDPPIAYCAATKTVYKISRDSDQCLWVEQWDMSDDHHIQIKSKCKAGPSSSIEGLIALLPSDINNSERELRMRCNQDRHLVVTGDSGEADPVLYLVIRHHNRELGISQTRAVDVFRFDLVGERMTYTTKLDDHAFFIGTGSDSFAIPIDKCPELKRDSIYIADDLSVFDLKDGSTTPIVDMGDLSMTRLHAFWISPPSQEQIEQAKTEEKRNTRADSEL